MPGTEPNTAPIYYSSEYTHGVDEKRRLQIPSKWRPEGDCLFTLVVWPGGGLKEACLLGLPQEIWANLVKKVTQMPFSDPTADSLRRLLGRKSDTVSLDRSGRICIPEAMAAAVAIKKEVKLVGLLDRFQIWNPERLAAISTIDESLSNEAFKLI
jgi:MraZ protein